MGLIVPRYRHSAVARNLLKRRLRELARLRILPTGLPYDLVVRVKPEAYDADFAGLATDIDRAVAQLTRWTPGALSPEAAPPPSTPSAS